MVREILIHNQIEFHTIIFIILDFIKNNVLEFKFQFPETFSLTIMLFIISQDLELILMMGMQEDISLTITSFLMQLKKQQIMVILIVGIEFLGFIMTIKGN